MAEAGGASGEKGVWNGVSARMGAGVHGAGVQGLARRGTRLGVASMAACAQIFPGGLACGLGLRGWLDWFAATGASALRGPVGASKPRSWLREANMLLGRAGEADGATAANNTVFKLRGGGETDRFLDSRCSVRCRKCPLKGRKNI